MVYYTGTALVFCIQINWNFISMAIAVLVATLSLRLRPLLTIYQQHINFKVLIKICRCVTDPNKIYLCSNMFYC